MNQLRLNEQAEADLDEVWLNIARDDPVAATRFVRTILKKCELLADQPGIGRPRGDLALELRSFAVGSYLILYRPIEGGIEVVRVLHGARDVEAQLRDRARQGRARARPVVRAPHPLPLSRSVERVRVDPVLVPGIDLDLGHGLILGFVERRHLGLGRAQGSESAFAFSNAQW